MGKSVWISDMTSFYAATFFWFSYIICFVSCLIRKKGRWKKIDEKAEKNGPFSELNN